MASHSPSDLPLQKLEHDPVPGYPLAFAICFAVMAGYLAIILYSSPGQVTHGAGHHGSGEGHSGSHSEKHKESKIEKEAP